MQHEEECRRQEEEEDKEKRRRAAHRVQEEQRMLLERQMEEERQREESRFVEKRQQIVKTFLMWKFYFLCLLKRDVKIKPVNIKVNIDLIADEFWIISVLQIFSENLFALEM